MFDKTNNIVARRRQLQQYGLHFFERLHDIKFAGMVLFVVIVLLISWSGVKSIQANYDLQKQISALKQQNQLQQLADNNLKLQNEYYDTDTYKDLAARQNFGLAAPGEKEILVPKSVALSYTTSLPKATTTAEKPADKQSVFQRNFTAWVNFFLHRQNTK